MSIEKTNGQHYFICRILLLNNKENEFCFQMQFFCYSITVKSVQMWTIIKVPFSGTGGVMLL